ncbi:MAG: hypothetical protein FWF22_10055, partial [Treponema sp.]|nr:hypothetical protein [Treponema sp.]
MEYDGPCRDLFYLAFIFLGAAIGLFLNWFRAGMNLRSRNRSVTAGLLLLSCSVAAIAVSLVITDARLFTVPAYYVIAAILAALSILSARFPRAAGFPLILAAGIVFVWIAYTFGQFPQLDGGGCIGSINTASGGQVSAELIPGTQVNFPADNFQCGITVTSFEYARFIPVIGGEL